MHRFFADENGILNGVARLEAGDANHALRVLRLSVGDTVQLFCGGEAYLAAIADISDGVAVRVLEQIQSPEATLRVTLYQGVPKGDKMDYIVQKCTEAGVRRIVPVNMPRCVARLETGDDKKLARWNRIAREAAKQAFRPVTPEVAPAIGIKRLPALLREHQLALVPWEDARDGALRQLITPEITDLAIVIGPEGGMSPEDVAPLLGAGAKAVTLGPRIFRTETAGLAAIVAAMAFSHNLE
ncbi:MAG: 16S rRNA (uracil(1498)-N(3))-methyltransferase [Clostridia bacterium]|nr:16S rRNA (uracil(1498)-N(3))-methyltransferase [Clostridia bacterium]